MTSPRQPAGELLDALVVGAGPAGLTAAIYLARFKRNFVVFHDERGRAGPECPAGDGVVDRAPDMPGVVDAVRTSLLRICPICDGFEVTGQPVAVIGDEAAGAPLP